MTIGIEWHNLAWLYGSTESMPSRFVGESRIYVNGVYVGNTYDSPKIETNEDKRKKFESFLDSKGLRFGGHNRLFSRSKKTPFRK